MAEPAQFQFDLEQAVRFAGMGPASDDLLPVVKGRMHDCNGYHYDVHFLDRGKPSRAWFCENQISRKPA